MSLIRAKEYYEQRTISSSISGIPHAFDVGLATKYGVNEAIMIAHFHHWIMVNQRRGRNFYEGRTWMYQTAQDIAAHFPYWSVDQVNRIIRRLLKEGVIIKGNFNKSKFDRTLWYAFDKEYLFCTQFPEVKDPSGEIAKSDFGESPNQNGDIARPIPYTKTDTKTEEGECPPSSPKESVVKHGEYQNILLTEKQYQRLVDRYGASVVAQAIQELSCHCQSLGKKYKDYEAALRTWITRDKKWSKNTEKQFGSTKKQQDALEFFQKQKAKHSKPVS